MKPYSYWSYKGVGQPSIWQIMPKSDDCDEEEEYANLFLKCIIDPFSTPKKIYPYCYNNMKENWVRIEEEDIPLVLLGAV